MNVTSVTKNSRNFCLETLTAPCIIAPKKCLHGWILARAHNKYVYGDLAPDNVEYMAGIQELDVTNLPSADGELDIVICNHVLEHVLDDVRAMREIYRVMEVGGIGVLHVPISWKMGRSLENSAAVEPEERTKIFGQSDHVRIYRRDYLDRLKNAGFAVELIEKVCADQKRFAVNPREKLFIVRK